MTEASAPNVRQSPSGRSVLICSLLGVLLVVVGVMVGIAATPSADTPATGSTEAGFARDMQLHHGQAVELSSIIRERTGDPAIRLMAQDIALTQQAEIGRMYGWLEVWGLPQASPDPAMAWMDRPPLAGESHQGMSDDGATPSSAMPAAESMMPGLASAEDIARLTALTGTEAEVLFLQLMIEHHHGGVEMAEALLERSENPVVTPLARSIVTFQSAAIIDMQGMLDQRLDQ